MKRNATVNVNEYLPKGHAVKTSPDELSTDGKTVWYLSHHQGWDMYVGTSLNDQLLQGSDLNNN